MLAPRECLSSGPKPPTGGRTGARSPSWARAGRSVPQPAPVWQELQGLHRCVDAPISARRGDREACEISDSERGARPSRAFRPCRIRWILVDSPGRKSLCLLRSAPFASSVHEDLEQRILRVICASPLSRSQCRLLRMMSLDGACQMHEVANLLRVRRPQPRPLTNSEQGWAACGDPTAGIREIARSVFVIRAAKRDARP